MVSFTSRVGLLTLLCIDSVQSFQPSSRVPEGKLVSQKWSLAAAEQNDASGQPHFERRQMLAVAGMGAWGLIAQSALAADEDLAMPSPEQVQKDEAAAMQERLRRKAELQKKMASPKTFNESLKNEFSKQGDMNSRTKEERRNAMCEELGRGC